LSGEDGLTDNEAMTDPAGRALLESEAQFKVLTNAMPQMVWSTLPDGYHDYYNDQWYEFTGVPAGSTDGEAWNGMFHPEDQERAWARWRHSLATGEPYEIEYRLRHRSGAYRWTLGRAQPVRDTDGRIIRWIGTCTDIDEAKRTAEQKELLGRELSHRIKNIFAVVSGLIALSARQHPEAKGFAADLRERIAALGRAHELVRPDTEEGGPVPGRTTLRAMMADLFRPYLAFDDGRIAIEGTDVAIDDRGATSLALLFHELATNAVKYGSLSSLSGTVTISIQSADSGVLVVWRETGGPIIAEPPGKTGFGTRLAEISVVQQLGGRLHKAWDREGLVVTISLDQERLARPES
jgi:PAS domain S-box-containing protein